MNDHTHDEGTKDQTYLIGFVLRASVATFCECNHLIYRSLVVSKGKECFPRRIGEIMGNCYGKGGSKRQSRELAKAAATGNGINRGVAAIESRKVSDDALVEEGLVDVKGSEETDGVPLSQGCELASRVEEPATQNTHHKTATTSSNEGREISGQQSSRRRVLFSAASSPPRALVQYTPPREWSTCAYCCNPSGDRYGYFLCSNMSPSLLDMLMENGWWRTGKVIFKPCFPVVCCPGYALRLPISEFVLKKRHRKVIRKWAQFLRQGDSRWENRSSTSSRDPNTRVGDCGPTSEAGLVQVVVASVGVEKVVVGSSEAVTTERSSASRDATTEEERSDVSQSHGQQGRQRRRPTPGQGADLNRPPCRKAKLVREEKRRRRLEAVGKDDSPSTPPHAKPHLPSLHDLLSDHRLAETSRPEFRHKLSVKLLGCNPCHPDLVATLPKAYELYDKFQESVHSGKTRFRSAEEFKWGFMTSPVVNPTTRLEGSYHMHYYLDDRLIMISILDILPKYFVSIYFIYDPAIRFMTPGIYTVLVEMDLVQRLQTQCGPRPQYYALGYYNCNPKVSYKNQFKPQEVLCNETHVFVRMDTVSEKLSKMAYTRLADDVVPEKPGRTAPLDNVLVNYSATMQHIIPLQYRFLNSRAQRYYDRPLRELVSETGVEIAEQMIISIFHTSSST